MSGTLRGIRVLDLTNVLAGPYCTYQLALLGAEVLKVEAPDGGDLARQLGADAALNAGLMGASFLAQNAGKRSLTLNLKADAGKDVLRRLVASSDVLVENFRPGVMTRLGIDHAALRQVNPRLVYCAISGFGQDGPMRSAPAYDQIIQGLSGMMSITGTPDAAPLRVGYPVADTLAGMVAAFAIAAALAGRNRGDGDGNGDSAFIDVSMLDTALGAMGWVVSNLLTAGVEPQPQGNDNFTAAPSGAFRARDGLINIAANKQQQFVALLGVLGLGALAADPRFATREARKQHRGALTAALEAALGQRSCAEWEALLTAAGVPAGSVLSVRQALALPQVAHRALLKTFDAVPGTNRPLTVTRAGFRIAGDDPDVASPPPQLGADTDAVLQGLGYGADAIRRLHADGVV